MPVGSKRVRARIAASEGEWHRVVEDAAIDGMSEEALFSINTGAAEGARRKRRRADEGVSVAQLASAQPATDAAPLSAAAIMASMGLGALAAANVVPVPPAPKPSTAKVYVRPPKPEPKRSATEARRVKALAKKIDEGVVTTAPLAKPVLTETDVWQPPAASAKGANTTADAGADVDMSPSAAPSAAVTVVTQVAVTSTRRVHTAPLQTLPRVVASVPDDTAPAFQERADEKARLFGNLPAGESARRRFSKRKPGTALAVAAPGESYHPQLEAHQASIMAAVKAEEAAAALEAAYAAAVAPAPEGLEALALPENADYETVLAALAGGVTPTAAAVASSTPATVLSVREARAAALPRDPKLRLLAKKNAGAPVPLFVPLSDELTGSLRSTKFADAGAIAADTLHAYVKAGHATMKVRKGMRATGSKRIKMVEFPRRFTGQGSNVKVAEE